jgi:hypothetical protein
MLNKSRKINPDKVTRVLKSLKSNNTEIDTENLVNLSDNSTE